MHIKFLDHGKGSAAHASAYVLDELDHLGNVRAGVEVLRGDATTFNAVCDASPHLWKYTSGVIAWSKEDNPTNEQIQEVLNDFEKHAFSGLDPSQYHLFAVLHTDNDGSKHIHVLAPRLDIQSGKSLNIAPPGHEKHFDSLRDYFNTKYQWSRPDDLLLMQTTQEPNHIAKLNAQAKNILISQDLETLTKKQFCKTVDNYVKTLLKTQTAENRADIVECIKQVKGIESIKQGKDFLTVTLTNGKKHRLKGDFYNEQFEIGLYSERLRAEAESRPTTNELAQAIRDAKSIRDDYRTKRAAYHSKQHAFAGSTADDNSPQIASKLDIDRNMQSITPIPERDDSELQIANRRIVDSASEYRYGGNIKSEIEHRFVFSLTSRPPSDHKPSVTGHRDRPSEPREIYSNPSRASNIEPKRADQQSVPKPFDGKIEQPESISWTTGDSDICSVDSFNQFLFRLSNTKQPKNNRSTKANNSAERTIDHKPNQLFEQPPEVMHANRNRPFFDRAKQLIDATKQLVSRTKQGFESTSGFIKDHLDRLQRNRTEITGQNQHFAVGESSTASLDLSTERRAIQNRAGQFFTGFTAKLSSQLNEPITNAINTSVKSSKFKQYYQQLSEISDITSAKDDQRTADRPRTSSLEALATESLNQYRRRLEDSRQATTAVRNNAWQLNIIDRKFEQLTELVKNIRIKPQLESEFRLRYDGYYPDYNICHERLSKKQDELCRSKNLLDLIDCIAEKANNLQQYTSRAWRNLSSYDYDKIEKIIRNDEIMLKYLKCEVILEPQNDRFESKRQVYQNCLDTFEDIKSLITERKAPIAEKHFSQPSPEPENKPKRSDDFELDF
ncbi:relaxase/mobilization nuclease domain-containing protein [Acinetobacter kyonggiensis]|uniref:Relaxase/Mobilisation nuclease domain-containing protein n=1 Tax=Acinetobacter kyonggiensis TaxID=595670 RepID=A0A1H3NME3_9GAMM|nr:relaxase/mobilization nuclease domain-containing protein [Acinetobacter kyonggiensis]SDY89923.1 Relaxase/Mobilisation nuclease domain-containing protein [Acinetobacter kyonggiensis]